MAGSPSDAARAFTGKSHPDSLGWASTTWGRRRHTLNPSLASASAPMRRRTPLSTLPQQPRVLHFALKGGPPRKRVVKPSHAGTRIT
eukprot:1196177-Prorocentrum_minimum.AAC.4